MQQYTLVPEGFFNPGEVHRYLSDALQANLPDRIEYRELPQLKAVLVYVPLEEGGLPPVAALLESIPSIEEHNKVALSFDGSAVHIAIATGEKLLLANSYAASDTVTAEYYLFAAMKQFQLNPQVTTVYIAGTPPPEMTDDLVRYCKGVETI